jgi:hypothetical protein
MGSVNHRKPPRKREWIHVSMINFQMKLLYLPVFQFVKIFFIPKEIWKPRLKKSISPITIIENVMCLFNYLEIVDLFNWFTKPILFISEFDINNE